MIQHAQTHGVGGKMTNRVNDNMVAHQLVDLHRRQSGGLGNQLYIQRPQCTPIAAEQLKGVGTRSEFALGTKNSCPKSSP